MTNIFSEGLAVIPSDPAAALEAKGLDKGTDADKVQLLIRLPPETRRALKHLAADGDTSVQKLMDEALADLFVKYRLPPSG